MEERQYQDYDGNPVTYSEYQQLKEFYVLEADDSPPEYYDEELKFSGVDQ